MRDTLQGPPIGDLDDEVRGQIDGAGRLWGCRMWHREGGIGERGKGKGEMGIEGEGRKGKGEGHNKLERGLEMGGHKKAITITAPVHFALLSHRVSQSLRVRVGGGVISSHLISTRLLVSIIVLMLNAGNAFSLCSHHAADSLPACLLWMFLTAMPII